MNTLGFGFMFRVPRWGCASVAQWARVKLGLGPGSCTTLAQLCGHSIRDTIATLWVHVAGR